MHVQNLKLFQNPAIYFSGNDVIIPANLFPDDVKTKIAESGNFLLNFQIMVF